ncbi:alpha/beta fold hydrolase [Radicibacter daui]|uniref:alpha/beta fold hydrolase n=1 Tax=Radicibacter daui TaxID=3064829 RepID=UPI004046DDCF
MKISANGIMLQAQDQGDGDVALVFLHYWGGTAQSWRLLIDTLPDELRTIALDARGWGGSDRPADGYDIATMADDVAAAISSLGLQRYVLVGHSMGGKVAQLLASRRPSGLAGLVLVAPSPAQGKHLSAAEREGMAAAYTTGQSAGWTVDNVLTGRALPSHLREQVISGSLAGSPAARESWPARAIVEDVSANLADIEVPVLVIGGELDKVDSVEMLRSVVLPSLPEARLSVVAGAGHLLPLEAPEEVGALLADFVAGLSATSATPTPEDIPGAFDEAFNRGDIDGVLSLFHPQAVMRMTDGVTVAGGAASLREHLRHLLAARPVLHNRIRRVLVSGDTALLLLDWEIRVPVQGRGDEEGQGTATQVAERCGDGNWRLRIANPLGIA